MDMEFEDYIDLAKAYQGTYEGDDTYFRRISNEVKAIKGEYKGFGTYLQRLSKEAKARRDENSVNRFPTKIIAVSVASLAAAGFGLLAYFFSARKKRVHT